MAFEDNKKFWKEFIELYREQGCLWDVNSKDYSNRSARNRAYTTLVIKCREKYPNAEKYFVAKKINSLRTSFRRQFRKLQHSKNPIAEPTLWYFDLLLFTIDQDELRSGAAFPSVPDELGYEDMAVSETDSKQEYILPEPHDQDSDARHSCSPERMEQELAPVIPSKPGWRKKKDNVNSKDPKKKDSNSLYGEFVADSIRNLKNKSIQSWVRNQISNVLYTAEQVYFQSICQYPRVDGMNFSMDTSTLPKMRREDEDNRSDSDAKQPKGSPSVNESVSTSPSTSKPTEIYFKEEPLYDMSPSSNLDY